MLLLLSSLVWWRARSLLQWKLAIVAAEFSAWWLWACAGLLVVGFWIPGAFAWPGWLARLLLLGAAFCFLRPWIEGALVLRRLPAQFRRAFPSSAPLFVRRLLWSVKPASTRDQGRAPRTVRFAERDGLPLEMDLFLPPAGRDRVPIVVVVHGGGWDGGSRDEIRHFNSWLASTGCLVAAPDYRLAPRHPWPAGVDDIRAAIAFLQSQGEEWLGDPERLVLVGRSAGGQIAQSVAYRQPPRGLRGLVSLYAPSDLVFAWVHSRPDDVLEPLKLLSQYVGGTYADAPHLFRSASPYQSVSAHSVPTLLVHGQNDALVWHRQSERLHARLNEVGAPSVFLDIPWGTHALEFNLNGPSGRIVRTAVEAFVREVTQPTPS